MKLMHFFSRKKDKKFGFASVCLVVSGFLMVVLPTLAKASIWFDEAFSAYIIRHDFLKIWHFTSVDVHPPLYYFALKVWSLLFGSSDFALRSMSVFFSVLTIIAGFYFIKRIFGSRHAILSIALLSFSPMFVKYSQEARMYTMVAFFAVMTARAFYEIYLAKNSEKSIKKWRIVFVASAVLGIWTQYLSGLMLVSLWILRLILLKKDIFSKMKIRGFTQVLKVYFSQGWLKLNIWIMVLFLPWIPFFVRQAISVKSGFWIQDLSFNTIPNYISNMFTFVNSGDLNGWWSLVLFVGATVLSLAYSKKILSQSLKIMYLTTLSIFPVIVLFVLSLPPFKSIFVDRYILSAIVFTSLLMGVIISELANKYHKLAICLFVLVISSFIYGNYEVYRQNGFSKTSNETTETRQVINRIKEKSNKNEPIVVTSGYFFYEAVQYSTEDNKVWFVDSEQDYRVGSLRMLEENSSNKIKDLSDFSKKYSKVWAVYNYGETEKQPLDKSWRLLSQEIFKDPLTNRNRYLVQEFAIRK